MLSSFLVMLFWGASAHLFIYGTFLSQWDTDFSFFAGRDSLPALLYLGHFFLNGTLDSHFSRPVTIFFEKSSNMNIPFT